MTKKLTVNSLALGNLKTRKKQYTLMIIGIILAMVFSSGVPFFISCMNSSQIEVRQRRQGKQDHIVINAQNYDFEPMIEQNSIESDIGYCHVLSFLWNEKEDITDGTMVGWLDENAEKLYYLQISEGRMPETEGEIAFEKNALQRMKIDAKIGDKITFKSLTCNGAEFLTETKEATYTLVGILSDKKANVEHLQSSYVEKATLLPAAFVAKGTNVDLGGKEALVAFVKEFSTQYSLFCETVPYEDRMQTNDVFRSSVGDAYSTISNNIATIGFLFVLLAFLSCFGIVNTFNTNLKERKTQVGMLKAVGATRRQIINIFGREAFIICALSAPFSIGLSFVSVKLFAKVMGENFVFKPDITVLLIGAAFSVICVMLSALIPLWKISKLPPMQAIRDIELMRKMKNKRIKSQKHFNVSKLLAKRKLTFSKGRQIGVCIIIALSIVICCISMSFLYTTISTNHSIYVSDYEIYKHRNVAPSNSFINQKDEGVQLTENLRQEAFDLPQVANVYGKKFVNINIVFPDDNIPEYLQINEYAGYSSQSSRFMDKSDVAYQQAVSTNGPYNVIELVDVTRENIKEFYQAAPNPDYTYTKQVAGFTSEELINTTITATSEETFDFDEYGIIGGEIDFEKINKGEEIVIYAPEEIGFSFEKHSDSGYSWGLYNLGYEYENSATDKEMLKNIIAEAESPFEVGDTLTLSLLCYDSNGNITRKDKDVKIGAIVGKKGLSGNFEIYTTLQGLDTFGTEFNYLQFDIELKEECTAEIDAQMQTELSAIFPGMDIGSAFAFNESEKQEFRTIVVSVASLILVLLCVCISLINNSVSAQIREGKRSIGTLRAVGASEKDLSLSYLLQISSMLLWGALSGTAVYVVSYKLIGRLLTGEYWPIVLWPAFLVFLVIALSCYINLRAKIKTVTKHSIVENIRELG